MFDSVIFKCPNCGADIEEQSKAGICVCETYEPDEVPLSIAMDINRQLIKCYDCGAKFCIRCDSDFEPPRTYKMRLEKVEP